MLLTVPNYYDAFHCIASACKDNCCVGWEIGIDDVSLLRYRSVPGTLGEHLNAAIQPGTPPFFQLTEQKRCPFLNSENLCELYIHLGEDALCEICTEHPRFHNWFGETRESGLGLCCEEAARLLLTWPEPFALVQRPFEHTPDEENTVDPSLLKGLQAVRDAAFSILQNRILPFQHRLTLLLSLAQDLQNWFAQAEHATDEETAEAAFNLADFYGDPSIHADMIAQLQNAVPTACPDAFFVPLLEFLQTLAPNDPAWPSRLKNLEATLSQLLEQGLFWQSSDCDAAERIACYFVYRYFLSAAVLGDALGGLVPAVTAALVIRLIELDTLQKTGHLEIDDRILAAKTYSKEIEYAPDNLSALNDAIWEADFFAPMNLLGVLLHQ